MQAPYLQILFGSDPKGLPERPEQRWLADAHDTAQIQQKQARRDTGADNREPA
jgi:hypothetical protein